MAYIVTLIVLVLIYGVGVLFVNRFKNTRITNATFCIATFLLYAALVVIVYSDVGPKDWNFLNTLPTANVSPFMFCTAPILYLAMPKPIRKYYLTLLALLSVGMLLSPAFNCIHNAKIHYAYHPHFLLDYVAHILLSLWGVYAIRSKQIDLNAKDSIISGSFIVCVAIFMMILNVIFDKSFFGLSLNGKHNIYNNVLVSNSYLSALIYFGGLIIILFLGYLFSKAVKKIKN